MNDLTSIEKIGRMLCKDYYNGTIQPGSCEEAMCVEAVIKNHIGMLELMSGLLSKAHVAQRIRSLGAGYIFGIYDSIDGREGMLRVNEVAMYAAVGAKYRDIIKKVIAS